MNKNDDGKDANTKIHIFFTQIYYLRNEFVKKMIAQLNTYPVFVNRVGYGCIARMLMKSFPHLIRVIFGKVRYVQQGNC